MRYKYQSFATDGNGSVIQEATINIYLAGSTTAASVYAASSGGTAVNSVESDSNGYFYFWVEGYDDGVGYTGEQLFKLIVSKTHFGNKTLDNIEILPLLYAGTGTTANRPTVTTVGMYYIDTDLGQPVYWDGSAWTLFSLASDSTPQLGGNLDMNGKNIQGVTPTEMSYIDPTSSIQTQINTKAPIADPTFTGEIGIGSVNVSETELGILEDATVTTTQLNYCKPTSDIQTQITNSGVKAWISFDGTGTISINDSYNVSSITDNGTGDYTITWDTDFADTNYCVVGSEISAATRGVSFSNIATGSVSVHVFNSSGAAVDGHVSVMAIGAQ